MRLSNMKGSSALLILLLAISHNAAAAVIYDESINGDTNIITPPVVAITLTDTILGFTTNGGAVDWDGYILDIDASTTVTDIFITASNVVGTGFSNNWYVYNGPGFGGPVIATDPLQPDAADYVAHLSGLSLTNGQYRLDNNGWGGAADGDSYNYTITFSGPSGDVPVPTPLLLMLVGLAALPLSHRKRAY